VKSATFALALHGGAGLEPAKLSAAQKGEYHASLRQALEVGWKLLAHGGGALDAVEQTVRALEDDPLYNAGRGSVFNSDGRHELDASIMDGASGSGGGVAGILTVKNPISLARLVMAETPHVLLIGEGAERFADEMRDREQIARVPNDYFSTERRRREWQEALVPGTMSSRERPDRGTVGCVALDAQGNLAAGTSTGGTTNKKFGRVGDTPILGAGTYAANETCAVSSTGTGEYFIRQSAAFHVSALMAYKGLSVDEAVKHVVEKLLPADVGGIIALDRQGHISMHFNTAGMPRASADASGNIVTGLERS
jgi:beta-aspartyl-peptidase (threonine type)